MDELIITGKPESDSIENAHVAVDTCGDSLPTVNSVDTDTSSLAPEPPCESLVSSGSPAVPLLDARS